MAKEPSDFSQALRTIELGEARWQAVLERARDAIISIDEAGRITLFNPMAEEIFGYPAAEVLGQNVRMLMPSPYREEHDGYLRNYRETGVPKAIGLIREVQAQRKNGEVFPIELSVSEAHIGDQRLHTAIIRDISERHRAARDLQELQQRIQQQERLADIGAITAKVVHDIKNPLAGLSMQAQLLLRRSSEARTREPAQRILETIHRLDGLLEEFNDFAREQRLRVDELLLPSFLESVVSAWRPTAEDRRISMGVNVGEAVAAMRCDQQKLRRVLDNVLKNAIEAIDRGPGEVQIEAAVPTDETVLIKVGDSGPGIPEGIDVFRLFETTKSNGTGLGLAIAREIVIAHGGFIAHAPGATGGTIFTIELPRNGPRVL